MPASEPASFSEVERRLALYLRALWTPDIGLRPLIPGGEVGASRRATFDGGLVRLPPAWSGAAGPAALTLYWAAAAHAGAHIEFTTGRFPLGELKPLQVALVSLLEDARVEQLALEQYPGLRRLWGGLHTARSGGAVTALSLMGRLSRALLDPDYEDDDPWVGKGRRMFLERRADWGDQSISRSIGSLLGNDLGQMRLQFNARTYVVEPAYRDDNWGLWDLGDAGGTTEDEAASYLGARISGGGETGAHEEPEKREARTAAEEQNVKRVAAGRPSEEAREEQLLPPLRYAEWDYVIQRDRPEWCTVVEKPAPEGNSREIDDVLERDHDLLLRLRRLVRAVQVHRPARAHRRLDGDRLDLDACIDASIDVRTGVPPDPRVYSTAARPMRDLSVLVLLDLSQSTGDPVAAAGKTVLALAREATALLADSMEHIGDAFAIHGFSSNGRHEVCYRRFKDFERSYDGLAKARLAGMRSELSTRMGAALRHAGTHLRQRRAHRKLILLVTDGEPSDIDVHDSEYLAHDAKKAVQENRRQGIDTFCMSMDPSADRYVARIFGIRNYVVVDQLHRLPEKLPFLYLRLTH